MLFFKSLQVLCRPSPLSPASPTYQRARRFAKPLQALLLLQVWTSLF